MIILGTTCTVKAPPGEIATTEADRSASNPSTESSKPTKGSYRGMFIMGGFYPNDYSGDYMYTLYSDSTPGEITATEVDQSASNPTTESSKPETGIFDSFKIDFSNSKETNETTTPNPDDELTTESYEMITDNLTSDMSMNNETVKMATTESPKNKMYKIGGVLSL